ncbi:MAG: ABC transporter ATP-binding protein/permease [Candidatus Doudnabacteria bacterium]|nr:ABC transporter ATP-binding protein/permease [Candidatus Doudnabacteria bacterium]
MKLLWNYIKEYKKILVGTLVLATINQVFSLLDPQIFRLLIDNYASRIGELSGGEFFRGVGLLLLAAMGVAFISRVAKNFQDYYANVIVQRVGTNMYSQSVQHSFSLPYSVFEDQRSGEFLQKLQKARTDSEKLITSSINLLFISLVGIVFVLIYASVVHWSVGLGYFLMIPLLGGTIFYISRRIKEAQQRIIKESASLAGSTTETIRNVELVKSLGLEQQEINRLNAVNEQILQLELQKIRLVRALSFVQGTLINGLRSVLMFLMLWLVFTKAITLGEFFSLLFYSFFIFSPLGELGNFATAYQETRASMGRLEEIYQTEPEPKPANPVVIENIRSIEFIDVDFSYPSSPERPAASDLSFKVDAGSNVAFVGPSGSGKTTIIKLIVGLYKPVKGNILFNGKNAKDLDFEKIRSKIGLVSQDTQLFAGTIKENLLFANPKASDEDCLRALRASQAITLVERGDKGLETKIGEGGLKLSGGEKQRLAIARALLRKPELIIFDEATSSLDSLTEQQITQTIRNIEKDFPNLITVMVAHRLSTIAHASNIYVLENGKIVEQGRHNMLLEKGGLYAALWRQQIAVKENAMAV